MRCRGAEAPPAVTAFDGLEVAGAIEPGPESYDRCGRQRRKGRGLMFEYFTEDARRVIVLAQEESRRLGHRDIRTEHLLLGLLHIDDDDTASAVLGVTLAAVSQAVAAASPPDSAAATGHIPFSTQAKHALELAFAESSRQGGSTGPAHLLLGVLIVKDPQVNQVLTSLGVDLDDADASARARVEHGATSDSESEAPAGHNRPTGSFVPDRPEPDRRMPHRAGLAAALRRFGRHDDDCPAPAKACTCGLDAALDVADRGPRAG